jgi:UDP-2,3-diacylglucosamine pyrophosphatase LpxH
MANTQAIHAALERVFRRTPTEPLALGGAQYIIFSDQHRGQRDGADDFLRSEATYLAALASYEARGFTLIMLGDAEELWECRPQKALPAYERVAAVERGFNDAGRYVRIFGNHDDRWMDRTAVERHLIPRFGPLEVREALRWQVTRDGRVLGELFLVHGHQGTWGSDKNRKLSRWFVRHIWRPVQRVLRVRLTTPARDECLRERHDIAMYEWTRSHPGVALIAGHTHRPVWTSRTHVQQMEEELAALRERHAPAAEIAALEQRISARRAKDRYCEREHGKRQLTPRPAYFNSGCCCFEDGNVTGIEIDAEQIRLVKWEGSGGAARRLELAAAALPQLFADLGTP